MHKRQVGLCQAAGAFREVAMEALTLDAGFATGVSAAVSSRVCDEAVVVLKVSSQLGTRQAPVSPTAVGFHKRDMCCVVCGRWYDYHSTH